MTTTRTSASHPIQVGWLPFDLLGRVGLTFAPGKGQADAQTGAWARDLETDVARLRGEFAVDHLVCLLEDHELTELAIPGLPEAAHAAGMSFHRYPIRDGSLPAKPEEFRALTAEILGWAAAGETVVIHCKGGLGRAGTVGGCVLRAAGIPAKQALEALHMARGPNCPETFEQCRYIEQFVPAGPSRRSRVLGAVIAAAVGDALGHPTEFLRTAEEIRRTYPPAGVTGYAKYWRRDGRRFAPYTDDTQMAEIVLRALVDRARTGGTLAVAMEQVAAGFVEWAKNPQGGHRAPGNACLAGAHQLRQGVPWREAGGANAGGCGSVMRVYPFGLLLGDDIEAARKWAVDHSRMTHQAPIALAACGAMATGVALELRGSAHDQVAAAMIEAAATQDRGTAAMMSRAVEDALTGQDPDGVLQRLQGWAAHEAIAAALYVVARHPDDVRAALLEGANAPGDSDSIATLAGALLGARLGLESIPGDWIRDLERSEELLALAKAAAAAIGA